MHLLMYLQWYIISNRHIQQVMDNLNTLASGCFRGFSKKKPPKRTWLCAGISPLLFRLRTCSKHQKTQQVF